MTLETGVSSASLGIVGAADGCTVRHLDADSKYLAVACGAQSGSASQLVVFDRSSSAGSEGSRVVHSIELSRPVNQLQLAQKGGAGMALQGQASVSILLMLTDDGVLTI